METKEKKDGREEDEEEVDWDEYEEEENDDWGEYEEGENDEEY